MGDEVETNQPHGGRRSLGTAWIILVVALLITAFLIHNCNRGLETKRYVLRMFCWNIGKDLLTNTNSERLVSIDPKLREQLQVLLTSPSRVEAVRFGDDPQARILLGQATARLYLVNERNEVLEIRLAQTGALTNFQVLGWSGMAPPPR